MSHRKPEPVQVVQKRRDAALRALVHGVPYVEFLGIEFERRGDELTALLPFADKLIGNPMLPAIHGGVTAAFLETSALIELSWSILWDQIESGRVDPEDLTPGRFPQLPKTILYRGLPALGPAAHRLCAGAGGAFGAALCQRSCRSLAGQARQTLCPRDREFSDADVGRVKVCPVI